MKRGDFVWIERGPMRMKAMVVLASGNGVSLMVMFDGMFCGYVGSMPLLKHDDGVYYDLMEERPVKVFPVGAETHA